MQILSTNKFAQGIEYKDTEGNLIGFTIEDNSEQAIKILEGYAFDVDFANETVAIKDYKIEDMSGNRIDKYTINKTPDITDYDFTLIGFRKETEYEKGRKKQTDYLNERREVVVRKTFSDLFKENGIFEGIKILFEWFDVNDTVTATKEQYVYMDNFEASIYLQRRRERAIAYLSFSAQGTPIEPFLTKIFEHYQKEISKYISIGSDDFKNAVQSEENPEITPLLGIEIPRVDGKGTIIISESILEWI